MPVEFLSDEQAAAFGRFDGEPSRVELERFFVLDQVDAELIGRRRGDHNRLGFEVQLGTVRFLGAFLPDPIDVPWAVVDYLAAQLGISDSSVVNLYAEREKTHLEHAWEIRAAYGYRHFADPDADGGTAGVHGWAGAWTHAEGPQRLFEQAAGWLRRNRVLLPGASVVARLTSRVREAAAERIHRTLADAAAAGAPPAGRAGVGDETTPGRPA